MRAQAIIFEGANPRHEHEWEDWKNARLPDDKILVPGVINSTNNFVEHPRLVAQRIKRYADIVGRERVIAGTDCGFGTFALEQQQVFLSIVWSKLKALSEGVAIASADLWGRSTKTCAQWHFSRDYRLACLGLNVKPHKFVRAKLNRYCKRGRPMRSSTSLCESEDVDGRKEKE